MNVTNASVDMSTLQVWSQSLLSFLSDHNATATFCIWDEEHTARCHRFWCAVLVYCNIVYQHAAALPTKDLSGSSTASNQAPCLPQRVADNRFVDVSAFWPCIPNSGMQCAVVLSSGVCAGLPCHKHGCVGQGCQQLVLPKFDPGMSARLPLFTAPSKTQNRGSCCQDPNNNSSSQEASPSCCQKEPPATC